MAAARTSKALTAWRELNDRQQGTLAIIYELDQHTEAGRKADAARGVYDNTPAKEWRRIDFTGEVSGTLRTTRLQERLLSRGWHSSGNGPTMAALAKRGLIEQGKRWDEWAGVRVLTVTLTATGRAAARAGLELPRSKAALSARAWEVLTLLWIADQKGTPLEWRSSSTIDRVLIGRYRDRHEPPLAEELPAYEGYRHGGGGYQITEAGRMFYRERWAQHAKAHADVRAPHPDGGAAEIWPADVDALLVGHRRYYRALLEQWEAASRDERAAAEEAEIPGPDLPEILPAQVAQDARGRHAALIRSAKERAKLAGEHVAYAREWAERAARDYAHAALTAFGAAVAGTSPLDNLSPHPSPTDEPADEWETPQRLPPPAATGIPVIDDEAIKRHAAAVGQPVAVRGPAPYKQRGSQRTRRLNAFRAELQAKADAQPGRSLVDLADFLVQHTNEGALVRRLHPLAGADQ